MKVRLSAIELDASIQCRAAIDTARVNEYAEHMADGAQFPPVDLFGSEAQCWIGDGWHRVLAVQQRGVKSIEAVLHPGGRIEALKCALGANALHGLRRTNEDKRRCVEIALREFGTLSSRAIAELCGVSHVFVEGSRGALESVTNATRTTADGRQYPAKRQRPQPAEPEPVEVPADDDLPDYTGHTTANRRPTPPCTGLMLARLAISRLEEIPRNDVERTRGLALVREWIDANA